MSQIEKLSLKIKLGYGAGEFASSIFWITMAFWLMNYLTDEVGLSAALAGLAIMVGKALDAVIDPAVGFLSDRTQSRWGRRRPWFLFGAVPFGVAYFIMFTNFHIRGTDGYFHLGKPGFYSALPCLFMHQCAIQFTAAGADQGL